MSSCASSQLARHGGLATGNEEEQKRYFTERRLYTIQIESTNSCPQDCIYCYAGAGSAEERGLTSDEIRGIFDVAASREVRVIDWLGGDPLLRSDWYELMSVARAAGLTNNLWTSGLPLNDGEVARKVHEVTEGGFVSVHVDSIHPETYARLHHTDGADRIAQVVEGVDRLLALGKSPEKMINCIAFTSLQDPEDAIDTMRWWLEEKGLRTCLTMFNPAGMGASMRQLEPGPEATRLVYEARDRLNYGDTGVTIACMDTDKYYCGTMATVTYDGDVTPCSVIREGVGNLRTTPLDEILDKHLDALIHAKLHEPCNLPAPCDECESNDHCWGCRASAFHYSGDSEGLDPKCWKIGK